MNPEWEGKKDKIITECVNIFTKNGFGPSELYRVFYEFIMSIDETWNVTPLQFNKKMDQNKKAYLKYYIKRNPSAKKIAVKSKKKV